jgi:PhnB protein
VLDISEQVSYILSLVVLKHKEKITMSQLNPYLRFNGQCREAMTFYKDCLGGELIIQTYGDSPMGADMSAEAKNNVLHSSLANGSINIMAADQMSEGNPKHGETVTLCLVCSSRSDIDSFFSKLSQGGTIIYPLKDEFFGTYGELTDKYGFSWMFQYDGKAQG